MTPSFFHDNPETANLIPTLELLLRVQGDDVSSVALRRCAEEGLAWQQSRVGKWYLCHARFNRAAVRFEADRRCFHICPAHQSHYRETSLPNPRIGPSEEVREQMGQIFSRGYRALGVVAHPDHNGDTRTMQALNEAGRLLREVWAVSNEGAR